MSCELNRETEDDLNCSLFLASMVGEENKGMHYVAKLYALMCASSLCFRNAVWHKEEGFEASQCGGRQCSAHPAAEIFLSWETMRTCLNGYWMGNRSKQLARAAL